MKGKDTAVPVFDFQEKRRVGSTIIRGTLSGVVSFIYLLFYLLILKNSSFHVHHCMSCVCR